MPIFDELYSGGLSSLGPLLKQLPDVESIHINLSQAFGCEEASLGCPPNYPGCLGLGYLCDRPTELNWAYCDEAKATLAQELVENPLKLSISIYAGRDPQFPFKDRIATWTVAALTLLVDAIWQFTVYDSRSVSAIAQRAFETLIDISLASGTIYTRSW